MNEKKIELLAPGGSFESAVYAFKNGADAVYIGLADFSARKQARNFDLELLTRLKKFAGVGKKIYIALNTIIKEQEMEKLVSTLIELSLLGIDGIIVQDTGVLYLARTYFPQIAVHASTQLTVSTVDGVLFLKDQGVKRVVLARELSFKAIEKIRSKADGIELEIFIHGALCYCISGLCLASGLLLNRSANRGECAQVCRTWFDGEKKNYYFSCNDLCLEKKITMLEDIGINSLKIEGRMKPPEYVSAVTAAYRAILDRKDRDVILPLLRNASLSFSRKPSSAFFSDSQGIDLINPDYPSHIGLPLGNVLAVRQNQFQILLNEPASVYDGLFFLDTQNNQQPVRWSIRQIIKNNSEVFKAHAGDLVWINAGIIPCVNQEIFLISSSENRLQPLNQSSFEQYKVPVHGQIVLTDKTICFNISGEALFALNPAIMNSLDTLDVAIPVVIDKAVKKIPFINILKELFTHSGDFSFVVEEISFINKSTLDDDAIFITPSFLKKFKNRIYGDLKIFAERQKELLLASVCSRVNDQIISLSHPLLKTQKPPLRSTMMYHGMKLPFIDNFGGIEFDTLPLWNECRVIALHPFACEMYLEDLICFLKSYKTSSFIIGLNNISQIRWIDSLRQFNSVFFVDYYLYSANASACLFYLNTIPGLVFIFYWIEAGMEDYKFLEQVFVNNKTDVPFYSIDEDFNPPLFISRICFKKHSLHQSCSNCTREHTFTLIQNKKKFIVRIINCMTYLYKIK